MTAMLTILGLYLAFVTGYCTGLAMVGSERRRRTDEIAALRLDNERLEIAARRSGYRSVNRISKFWRHDA